MTTPLFPIPRTRDPRIPASGAEFRMEGPQPHGTGLAPRCPMKVLVIDDDKDVRRATRDLLEAEDISVAEAEDAESGAVLLERERFDATLLDLSLPGVSWWEAVELVRRVAPWTRLIAFSAYADWDIFAHALELGAWDVIMKPYQSSELIRILRRDSSRCGAGGGGAPR